MAYDNHDCDDHDDNGEQYNDQNSDNLYEIFVTSISVQTANNHDHIDNILVTSISVQMADDDHDNDDNFHDILLNQHLSADGL